MDHPADRFLEVFRLAALQAGAVARRLQGEVRPLEKAGHAAPEAAALTAADLACQDLLLLALRDAFPEAAMDAEEETETAALFPPESPERPLVVVDPIDGTLNYVEGSPDYAVMGAWLEGGTCRAALVHFPARGETLWARLGGGAFREGAGGPPVRVRVAAAPRRVLVTKSIPPAWTDPLAARGYEVLRSRCSAVDSTAPVTGRAAAALSRGRPSRRRAIGYLITAEAGGAVRLGARRWRGEDPRTLPRSGEPALLAVSEGTAEEILGALPRG